MHWDLLQVGIGLVFLIWGADRFVYGAAATATNLGVAPLLIGLTIVAFATSAPEILVSIIAASRGEPDLAIGNAIGSNIANIGLVLGAVAIFVYVGAEVSIGSFLINFLGEENIAGLAESDAAKYIGWYWGGAMVGRFIGSVVMQKVPAGKVLGFNAFAAVVLLAIAIIGEGSIAMWAILLVGLCNSIMFPTIFSLGVTGLGAHTSQGSGILCLAIVGGALIPLLQGVLADSLGVQLAFVLPVVCYLYIAFYGLKGSKVVASSK